MNGLDGDDVVVGLDQRDKVYGGNGDDALYGDASRTSAAVQTPGNDIVHGYAGNDNAWAGAGDDAVLGGAGYDSLFGEAGGITDPASAGLRAGHLRAVRPSRGAGRSCSAAEGKERMSRGGSGASTPARTLTWQARRAPVPAARS